MPLDHLSFATTPVVALRDEQPLWQGSGFFYLHERDGNKVLYLVTNYHVISGLAPESGGESPVDHIIFQFHTNPEEPGEVRPVRVPLYTRQGQRVWIQQEESPIADLVAIPLPSHVCEGCTINCIDRSWAQPGSTPIGPASSIQLVGFPYGYHDQKNSLPLWQSGLLASEPDFDVNGLPIMLLDIPVYPGMSGAPAFAISVRSTGTPGQPGGTMIRRFIGIYASLPITDDQRFPEEFCGAGRPGVVARDAGTWGRVWRADVLEALVSQLDTERWEREILADLA